MVNSMGARERWGRAWRTHVTSLTPRYIPYHPHIRTCGDDCAAFESGDEVGAVRLKQLVHTYVESEDRDETYVGVATTHATTDASYNPHSFNLSCGHTFIHTSVSHVVNAAVISLALIPLTSSSRLEMRTTTSEVLSNI